MSNERRKVTLANFGEGPRWIADWCLARKDLDGFAMQVRESNAAGRGFLAVYLYRGKRTASQTFSIDELAFMDYLLPTLDQLAVHYLKEDEEATS